MPSRIGASYSPDVSNLGILKGAIGQGVGSQPMPFAPMIEREDYRNRILCMRLRIPDGGMIPFQHLSTALAGDKVFVFVVQDNQAVTLEDTAALFPSDQLITQLRLLDK